jgi:hypothetical protein
LAEKWCFSHVIKLVKHHFQHVGYYEGGLLIGRIPLALALKSEDQVNLCVREWHNSVWSSGGDCDRPEGVEDLIKKYQPYLYDKPVPDLLEHYGIVGGEVFDLGTWGYKSFLRMPPTAIWAILRARHKATTSKSVVDGQVFQDEFAKLMEISMAVSVIFDTRCTARSNQQNNTAKPTSK